MPNQTQFTHHQKAIVLDGALGTELEKLNLNIHHPLWSAYILITQPSIIEEIHVKYIESGSDLILTSSYQASLKGLLESGKDLGITTKEDGLGVLRKSVTVAKDAIARYELTAETDDTLRKNSTLIGGSIGPYGAYLCNGAEYTGDYNNITSQELKDFHFENVNFFFHDNDVDIISLETVPSFQEFKVLVQILHELYEEHPQVTKKFYISLNFKSNSQLCDGTAIEEVAQYVLKNPGYFRNMFAIGANCININIATQLLTKLHSHLYDAGHRFIVYPNSGEVYDGVKREFLVNETQHDWARLSLDWLRLGAVALGGCCRTGPKEIREIRKAIDSL